MHLQPLWREICRSYSQECESISHSKLPQNDFIINLPLSQNTELMEVPALCSVSPYIKNKGGGLSTLKLFMPGHIHCYPVLREHGKKGGPSPFGETLLITQALPLYGA